MTEQMFCPQCSAEVEPVEELHGDFNTGRWFVSCTCGWHGKPQETKIDVPENEEDF